MLCQDGRTRTCKAKLALASKARGLPFTRLRPDRKFSQDAESYVVGIETRNLQTPGVAAREQLFLESPEHLGARSHWSHQFHLKTVTFVSRSRWLVWCRCSPIQCTIRFRSGAGQHTADLYILLRKYKFPLVLFLEKQHSVPQAHFRRRDWK
jgi:hypothetical protein